MDISNVVFQITTSITTLCLLFLDDRRERDILNLKKEIYDLKKETHIVRCKDCKWWAGCSSDTIAECSNCGGDWKANEYCSCGERREEG